MTSNAGSIGSESYVYKTGNICTANIHITLTTNIARKVTFLYYTESSWHFDSYNGVTPIARILTLNSLEMLLVDFILYMNLVAVAVSIVAVNTPGSA